MCGFSAGYPIKVIDRPQCLNGPFDGFEKFRTSTTTNLAHGSYQPLCDSAAFLDVDKSQHCRTRVLKVAPLVAESKPGKAHRIGGKAVSTPRLRNLRLGLRVNSPYRVQLGDVHEKRANLVGDLSNLKCLSSRSFISLWLLSIQHTTSQKQFLAITQEKKGPITSVPHSRFFKRGHRRNDIASDFYNSV